MSSPKVHPVIVVGSGASGGMAAWNLTRQGIDVLMLDAGTKFDRSQFWTHVRPWEARERRAAGERPPQFFLDTKEQPYLTPDERPFELIRVWGHGGKTNVWGRVSLRYSDLDFKGPAIDGWEIPWPIEYKDVAPYYDKVEQLIGVCGGTDDSDSLPGSKVLLPPPAMRCGERLLKTAFAKVDIPIVPTRRANMTRSVRGFPACHYCGNCGAGCDTASFFCSADHLLPQALETGKLEIRSNAVVARVLVDEKTGLANGVQYFDRVSGQEQRVYGKVVVMGASAVDSTRILLNSKSRQHPNGLGNGSDVIGRYLCEQIRVHVAGFLPPLFGNAVQEDRGIGGAHIYMPRFNHRRKGLNYLRGFQMQFWNSGCHPANMNRIAGSVDGFGASFKKEMKRRYPSWVELHPFGETLPYAHNRITVDESRTDRYGVPLLKVDYRLGDNELKMADHIFDVLEEVGKAAGIEWAHFKRGELDNNGSAIHEHGCVRMGADPKRSALNRFNQMHEVKNVFVVDGSAFTSASEKNPTLTILSLSWRATDYLAEEIKKGNL